MKLVPIVEGKGELAAVPVLLRRIGALLDADDDCPATLGDQLAQRARAHRSDRRIRVVFAKIEFESWFLGGAAALAGKRGLPDDLAPPNAPESIRNAKGWLGDRMRPQRPGGYRETLDQPALSQLFDMAAARSACPSFDKFWRDVADLLAGGDARR